MSAIKDVWAFWGWIWTLVLAHLAGTIAALVAGVVLFFGVALVMQGVNELVPVEAWAHVPVMIAMLLGGIGAYLVSAVTVYRRRSR